MRTPAQNAELALLLEVASTPKPGNVDRERDFPDLRFEHFLAGAVGAQPGLRAAANGEPVGRAFERAVAGMSEQGGGNTQFGALLLLVPLVRVAGAGGLTPAATRNEVEHTTVSDATKFYRAFDHVDVFVDDPPADLADLDVRLGKAAIPTVEARGLTLFEVMEASADEDGVAAEWVSDFRRSFATAEYILGNDGAVTDRAARAFVDLLADEPDTLVAKQHGRETANAVSGRASELANSGFDVDEVAAWGDDLVARGINPGTTADIVAAGLFIALERGVEV